VGLLEEQLGELVPQSRIMQRCFCLGRLPESHAEYFIDLFRPFGCFSKEKVVINALTKQ
jgi:hypothetical protein